MYAVRCTLFAVRSPPLPTLTANAAADGTQRCSTTGRGVLVWDLLHARRVAARSSPAEPTQGAARLTALCWTHPGCATTAAGYADGSVQHYALPACCTTAPLKPTAAAGGEWILRPLLKSLLNCKKTIELPVLSKDPIELPVEF
jgi:hypothetical protein